MERLYGTSKGAGATTQREAKKVGVGVAELVERYLRSRKELRRSDIDAVRMPWQWFVDGMDGLLTVGEWGVLKRLNVWGLELFAKDWDEGEDAVLDMRWRRVVRQVAVILVEDWGFVDDEMRVYAMAVGSVGVWALLLDVVLRDDPNPWHKLVRRMSERRGVFTIQRRCVKGKVRSRWVYWVYEAMRRFARGREA